GTAILGYRRQPPSGGFQFPLGAEALGGKGLSLSESNRDPPPAGGLPWVYLRLRLSLQLPCPAQPRARGGPILPRPRFVLQSLLSLRHRKPLGSDTARRRPPAEQINLAEQS